MPSVFLSPSTQEWNPYFNGGNEELYMNQIADRMEPYLRSSGISFSRNDPARNVTGAIADSNAGSYDVHLALHSNAAPESLAGKLRGIDIYYSPSSRYSQILANIIADRFKTIYPIPDKCYARPTTTLGEVTQTKTVSVLCEIGYHDNEQDALWIQNHLTTIAVTLVQALCEYFGIPFVPAGAVQYGIVETDGGSLYLRAFPSTQGRILDSIPDQSGITIYGRTGNWYVISYQGITGYVHADYIRLL
jgi:N-acetylmuramoyl-L-alanine amidase